MQVSLTGFLSNAANALPKRAIGLAVHLNNLEMKLRELHEDRAQGEAAIDAFFQWYMVNQSLVGVIEALPTRATRACAQPGMTRFVLAELAKHLGELLFRKAEGTAVIDEFFAVYVFEQRGVAHA